MQIAVHKPNCKHQRKEQPLAPLSRSGGGGASTRAPGVQGTWAALRGGAWSPAVEPLAAATGRGVRARTLALLQRAYSALPPPRAAALLGLSEADVVACAPTTPPSPLKAFGIQREAPLEQHDKQLPEGMPGRSVTA